MESWETALIDREAEIRTLAGIYPNPPCQSWCQVTHNFEEFASSGGLICAREIGTGPGWAVSVEASRWVESEFRLWGPLGLLQVEVRVREGIGGGHLEAIAPDQATALGNALVDAARFCAMRVDR